MLIGFSGYLAGYNGSWDFPSGETYPDYIDYVKMRIFHAIFSALCVPLAYFTMKEIGFNRKSTWLFTLMVLFESSFVTLGKFILLDSLLLFFTVTSFYCFIKFHNENKKPGNAFSRKWWKWILLTGINLGCVCSVKMVGLFITSVVGVYTIVELWIMFGDRNLSYQKYAQHWLARIAALILVPFGVFLISFKIHFDLLYGTGSGDANMSSLFQANLIGSEVGGGPREIVTDSSILTIKNQGLGGGLLHSHVQGYPYGSLQQQVTTYSHKDSNNDWKFEFGRTTDRSDLNDELAYILEGSTVRVQHVMTGRNLHTHFLKPPVSKSGWEVSCYGNETIGDEKDDWIVEIVDQYGKEDKKRLHPLTTSFRLKSKVLGCYLSTTGNILPAWGFRQGEVVCVDNPFRRDKRTWWNVEDHTNPNLPAPPEDFKLPRTNFLKDFIQLNLAMMATNNALVPDPDKLDNLASKAWEWPTLHVGIRLCSWADDTIKYYLMGSPATTWTSTVAVLAFSLLVVVNLIKYQRQVPIFHSQNEENLFLMGGVYPFLGWFIHFLPFVIMSRVTYVHHYLPALYFAMIVCCYVFQRTTDLLRNQILIGASYVVFYIAVVGTFIYFSPISFGMDKPHTEYKYLNWLPTWKITE
ncbi:hypothetical protein PACTADRAFT_49736 [Pachysolen tannophilus NRRL Y-2460]|uniref:Dolichyl-phosphate-mannose--protein mannosyltransferase n=1 Tax=Pachysolen tannophilus NRRL Y-2460 TaxID=669874 RepID=A0A1E4TXA5_PACTA|nr:hypothetical protein PACTADRAFT_49736 [Pachysolen tannophilus NRRL Y-2460]